VKVVHVSQKHGDIRAQRAVFATTPGVDSALILGSTFEPGEDALHYIGHFMKQPVYRMREACGRAKIAQAIADLRPDVIHCHEPMTMRLVDLPLDVQIVLDHHEWEIDRSIQWDSPRLRQIRIDVTDQSARDPRVKAYITPSGDITRMVLERWGGHVYTVYNNPFWLSEDYRPNPGRAREALKDFICEGDKFIAFAGYMTPDRRIDLLLNTILHLQAEDPSWRILALSPERTIPPDIKHQLEATRMLVVDPPLAYPWPWSLDRLTMLDALALAEVGWSFAEVGFDSWRHSAPNKFFEYAAAGIPQICDRGTWMAGWGPGCNAGVLGADDDPAAVAQTIRNALPKVDQDRAMVLATMPSSDLLQIYSDACNSR
jgi:glycosyltransferase involved in cell wall biosynthesis